MTGLMFLIITIVSPSDHYTATFKIGPVPGDYCLSESSKRDAAPFLASIAKDAIVTYKCVATEKIN